VTGVFSSVFSIETPEGVGRLFFRFDGIGRSYEFPPLADGVLRNKFHANREIRSHEVEEGGIERFPIMFAVKLSGPLLAKLEHLKIRNRKLFLSSRNHLAKIKVGVRFEHPIGPSYK